MISKIIPITRPSMPPYEEYIEEIKDMWVSGSITNIGAKHQRLEAELMQFLQAENLTLFINGHLALECIINAMKLTGEIITTPFTFVSTTHAITRNGLAPVFCDINPEDYTIDTDKLEALITEKTSAIIPVHVYGNLCKVNEIDRIAKKYKLKVIYDAAHAFGVSVSGRSAANFGDASMLSFHAAKVFNTIEGGAVVYQDSGLKQELASLKNYGIKNEESVINIGTNAKMNEFQAAMGICNLHHIEEEIQKRKTVVERYMDNLEKIKGIKLPKPQQGVKSNYAYFPILFEKFRLTRDQLQEELKKNNIYSRKYFYPLTNQFGCYDGKYSNYKIPVAEYVSGRILTLPLYADMTGEEVDRVTEVIKQLA